MTVRIEIRGLRLFGRHGVLEEERRDGQWFELDVVVQPREPPRADRLEEAVDYREIAQLVGEIVETERYDLLEILGAAVAERLLERFDLAGASVAIAKPAVTLAGEGRPRVVVERRRSG